MCDRLGHRAGRTPGRFPRASWGAATAYRHFADHHALLRAVCAAAMRQLARAMEVEQAAVPRLPPQQTALGRTPFGLLNAALDDLVAVGVLPAERRTNAELMAWSAVHGLSMLLIDGPLKHLDRTRADAVGQQLLDHVQAGLLADTGG